MFCCFSSYSIGVLYWGEEIKTMNNKNMDTKLTQLERKPTRGDALLDLLFMNREGLMGDIVDGSCLGQNDHKMIEFSILVIQDYYLGPWRVCLGH